MFCPFGRSKTKDQSAAIKKTAKFLGKTVTDEQMNELCEHLKFSNIAANPSINLNLMIDNKKLEDDPNSRFIRKGKVDDWKNYMSDDLTEQFDKWTEENLRGTGLKLDMDITSKRIKLYILHVEKNMRIFILDLHCTA